MDVLPFEIIRKIVEYLPHPDRMSLRQTCSRFRYACIDETDIIRVWSVKELLKLSNAFSNIRLHCCKYEQSRNSKWIWDHPGDKVEIMVYSTCGGNFPIEKFLTQYPNVTILYKHVKHSRNYCSKAGVTNFTALEYFATVPKEIRRLVIWLNEPRKN